MKTRVLKYLRKIQLLYSSSISSNSHPKSLQHEGGSRALRERKELTEGHTNTMASRRKHIQPFANRNFRSWNKVSSPLIDIQVSNSKVHLHNTYYAALFYHRVLLAECTNHFDSAVMIYFIAPKPTVKGSLLSAVWQAMVSICFTLEHITRVLHCSLSRRPRLSCVTP